MLQNIKEQILQKKFKKELSRYSKNRKTADKEVHSVGVLITHKIAEQIDFVAVVENTIKHARNSRVFSFRKFNKFEEKSFKHFSEKDINWQGKIIDPSLESFLETPFDLLIGYFDKKHLYLEQAVLKSAATFKAGFAAVNDDLFDLIIDEKLENHTSFINEIHKYLTVLKKA